MVPSQVLCSASCPFRASVSGSWEYHDWAGPASRCQRLIWVPSVEDGAVDVEAAPRCWVHQRPVGADLPDLRGLIRCT